MNKKTTSRLKILRNALKLTRPQFAKLTGLSVVYLKKLETASSADRRKMSKSAAVTIAAATGVHQDWLLGRGKPLPIMALSGIPLNRSVGFPSRDTLAKGIRWKKEMFTAIQNLPTNKDDLKLEKFVCCAQMVSYQDVIAHILIAAFKQNKSRLAREMIRNQLNELAAKFGSTRMPLAALKKCGANPIKLLDFCLNAELARRQ